MNREAAFEGLREHAWFGRQWRKLRAADLHIARDFLAKHAETEPGPFEEAVHRMFLDAPDKPRNFTLIQELLVCSNSLVARAQRERR